MCGGWGVAALPSPRGTELGKRKSDRGGWNKGGHPCNSCKTLLFFFHPFFQFGRSAGGRVAQDRQAGRRGDGPAHPP